MHPDGSLLSPFFLCVKKIEQIKSKSLYPFCLFLSVVKVSEKFKQVHPVQGNTLFVSVFQREYLLLLINAHRSKER